NYLIASASLRPVAAATHFVNLHERFVPASAAEPSSSIGPAVAVPSLDADQPTDSVFAIEGWTYDQWTERQSPLTTTQRRILESDIADRQPLRIAGAAGSGKTLLMMLLGIRMLSRAAREKRPLRVLYVVHNAAMQEKVWFNFITLGAGPFLEQS